MKRVFSLLVFAAAITVWCPSSFATENIPTDPATPNLTVDGSLNGVFITGSNTLVVNNSIVTVPNILTSNSAGPYIGITAVSALANDQAMVTFNHNSTVYGDMGATGTRLHLITVNDGMTVNFLGDVFSAGAPYGLETGTGTTNFEGLTNIVATNFTGDGTISLAPNTLVTGALTTNTDDTGTLALGSGSQLTGAVTGIHAIKVVGGNNTAGVSANITGAVGAHSFSLLTNTLNITGGALTIATGGVINTTLAGTSPTQYGHIVVTGGASNLGTGLDVEVTVPSTTYIPVGSKFNIVQSTSGTGALATVATVKPATNPLYAFSVDDTASAGAATIKTDTIPLQAPVVLPPDVLPPVITPIAIPVAEVLADIPSSPDIDAVRANLNSFTDPVAIVNAEAQLAPSTAALAAPLVTFQGIREFQNLWLSRLDTCSQDVNELDANCRGNEPRSGWWVKGFEKVSNQNALGAFLGYHSTIIGTMIACDTPIGLDTRAGLGFGYARSTIDGKTFDADTDFETYQATAYIGHENGPWFVNGSASLGWNEYSSMRHIVYPGMNRRAEAEYSGQDYTAFASTGYHFSVQKFVLTPLVSLQYSHIHLDDYKETGAGDIDLKVKSQDYDFLESGLGAKVERYFGNRDGTSYAPEGHFNWYHEFSNPAMEQTAKFTAAGSSSFRTPELYTDDNMFNIGGGLTLLSCVCSATTWSLEAVYDYDWRNDGYSANQVMMRFTSRF